MASFILLKSVMFFANAYQKTMKTKVKKMHKIKQKLFKCRICNKEKGNVPIFNNNIQPNIPEEIEKISGISISESDNLSKHMCQFCLDLLNGCILFRDMCQENNLILAEVSIKKEFRTNYEKYEESPEVKAARSSREDSYNIPSPTFSESNSDLWSCMFCGKEFINMATYDNHISNCSAVTTEVPKPPEVKKRFLCDTCGITTCSHATLLAHMFTHTNVFPFKCDVCPYQGRTINLLTVHKRSHMAEKPYKCTLCPKSTTTTSNLAKHMRHMHSTTRPHKCTYCDKAFTYQHVMKRHIRDIHLSQGMVQCDVCKKKFKSKNVLQDHRLKIHKIKGKRLGRLPSYLQCQMESGGEK